MSEEYKTLETPYGVFKYPVCEGEEIHLKDIVDYAIAMMKENGEQHRLNLEKEGDEKRKTRQQTWDSVKTLAPVVIDRMFKSAVSAAADYYREQREHEAEKEKQNDLDKLDIGNDPDKQPYHTMPVGCGARLAEEIKAKQARGK